MLRSFAGSQRERVVLVPHVVVGPHGAPRPRRSSRAAGATRASASRPASCWLPCPWRRSRSARRQTPHRPISPRPSADPGTWGGRRGGSSRTARAARCRRRSARNRPPTPQGSVAAPCAPVAPALLPKLLDRHRPPRVGHEDLSPARGHRCRHARVWRARLDATRLVSAVAETATCGRRHILAILSIVITNETSSF